MAEYPIKNVAGWIGNSAPVAMTLYAMAMEDSFTRSVPNGIARGVKTFSRQLASISDDLPENQTNPKVPKNLKKKLLRGSKRKYQAARLGLEPRIKESESFVLPITLSGILSRRGAKRGDLFMVGR